MKYLDAFKKKLIQNPLTKITFLVVAGLFFPLLSYLIFQLVEYNQDEEVIESIYEGQLESILFSVNTYSWDVFSSWVTELTTNFNTSQSKITDKNVNLWMSIFIKRYPQVLGSVVSLDNKKLIKNWKTGAPVDHVSFSDIWSENEFKQKLASSEKPIQKMIDRSNRGYTKPLIYNWEYGGDNYISLLVFPVIRKTADKDDVFLIGLFIDDIIYINEVTSRKFSSIDDSTFIFTIRDTYSNEILYSTEEFPEEGYEKSTNLWILPDVELNIKYRGATLQELASARISTNVLFLIIINLVLLIGIYYIIKNIKAQIVLAQMQTNFVANVSHELRTPLAIIRMFAETLDLGRVGSNKIKYYYKAIMNESQRLTQLINNILDFSKIQSTQIVYNTISTNLHELLDETLDMYQFHLEHCGFELEIHIDDHIPEIQLDPEAIKQVIINLLDNAVKFSMDEKKIVIRLKNMDGKIILSITDFGIGIPEDEQKKIFNKFYRAGNTTEYQTKGSGLGLVLVKNIMDFHMADIKLYSQPDKGSTFSLVFNNKDIQ